MFIAKNILIGFAAFILSLMPSIVQFDYPSNPWIDSFIVAMSFRTNNYFYSFLSMALCQSIGMENEIIVMPMQIEFSSSLKQVAKSWNIPTYHWLKKCK